MTRFLRRFLVLLCVGMLCAKSSSALASEVRQSMITNPKLFKVAGQNRAIPHILHYINPENRPLLEVEKARIRSWKETHPDWQWKIWTKDTVAVINKAAIANASTDMQREILRFEALNRYGGIAVDINVECLKSFNPLATNCEFFAGVSVDNSSKVKTSLVGAKPAHPVVQASLDRFVQAALTGQTLSPVDTFTDCFVANSSFPRDLLIPAQYVYPVPQAVQDSMTPLETVRKRYVKKESLAIQLQHAIVDIVIVIPTYNNGSNNDNACLKCLESVRVQKYPYISVICVDDHSSDNNADLIANFITTYGLQNKIRLIRNTERKGALQNLYETIHTLQHKQVVFTVDGDDTLKNPDSCTVIASKYADKMPWITFGSYERDIGGGIIYGGPLSPKVCKKNAFRKSPWIYSHARTFYAKLFQRIHRPDLLRNGVFYNKVWDLVIMYPMLEMSSKGHIGHIPEIIYVYSTQNPISDFRTDIPYNIALYNEIRAKPRYSPVNLW